MSRLDEIQNKYAQENGAKNWFELISNIEETHDPKIDIYYNDVYIVYTAECIKASLKKASEDPDVHTEDDAVEALRSINNPKNIVLL